MKNVSIPETEYISLLKDRQTLNNLAKLIQPIFGKSPDTGEIQSPKIRSRKQDVLNASKMGKKALTAYIKAQL